MPKGKRRLVVCGRREWVATIFAALGTELGRNVCSLQAQLATGEIAYEGAVELAGFPLPHLTVGHWISQIVAEMVVRLFN